MNLSRVLDTFVKPADVDGAAIRQAVIAHVSGCSADQVDFERYHVITAIAGTMFRYVSRQRVRALMTGRVIRAWHLTALSGILLEWIVERESMPSDVHSDSMRISLLRMQLDEWATTAPVAVDLANVARAMADVAATDVHEPAEEVTQ